MIINFIRHGMTEGNKEQRYIGKTDEQLCADEKIKLNKIKYPECSILISSPMLRCLQTAEIIYPDKKVLICDGFRETDFGLFEGKNHEELSGNAEYQKWIDSNGEGRFPGGDDPHEFRNRCISEFGKIVEKYKEEKKISLVVHGGVIMSVMERYAFPKKSFYEWHIQNGCGYITEYKNGIIEVISEIKRETL